MPRRKQLTFHIQDLRCAGHIIEELSQLTLSSKAAKGE